MPGRTKPLVLITGASGRIGVKLIDELSPHYRLVGLDLKAAKVGRTPILACDLTSDDSVTEVMSALRKRFGARLAAVIHLAAYFDFTGEDKPQYQSVNVEGTRRLVEALKPFQV